MKRVTIQESKQKFPSAHRETINKVCSLFSSGNGEVFTEEEVRKYFVNDLLTKHKHAGAESDNVGTYGIDYLMTNTHIVEGERYLVLNPSTFEIETVNAYSVLASTLTGRVMYKIKFVFASDEADAKIQDIEYETYKTLWGIGRVFSIVHPLICPGALQ